MKTQNILLPGLALLGAALLPVAAQAQDQYHHFAHNGNVNQRLENQNDRINQGVDNGTLNRHEAYRLRSQDRRIRYQANRDRFFHHGHLSPGERYRLNNRLNGDSGNISRHRHDVGSY